MELLREFDYIDEFGIMSRIMVYQDGYTIIKSQEMEWINKDECNEWTLELIWGNRGKGIN